MENTMLYFQADARDGAEKNGCQVCCCENATMKPGETNLIRIDYRNWAAPLLGKGLSSGTIVKVSECLNCNDEKESLPIVNNLYVNTVVSTDVTIQYDVQDAVKYELLEIYGLNHGVVSSFDAQKGSLVYKPYGGFTGYDSLWIKAYDNSGNSNIFEVIVSINKDETTQNPVIGFTPTIAVEKARIQIDRRNYLLSFAIEASPAAKIDDIYKITVRQPAIDCDCNKFWNEFCIDLVIGKCG